MKYSDALKIYNEGKPAWCSPRKGSNDYKAVLAIMKGVPKSLSKASLAKTSIAKSSLSKASLAMAKVSSKKPSSKSLMFKKAHVIQRY